MRKYNNINKLGISWNRLFISLLLGIIILFSMRCSGFTKNLINAPVRAVKNKTVQKWGSTTALVVYVCLDAARDAVDHNGGNINPKYWHAYKNGSIIALCTSAGLKAVGYGQGHFTLTELTKRFIFGEAPIVWIIWQDIAYDYLKYRRIFDYREGIYNDHRFMLPFFGKDRYYSPKKYQMITVDGILISAGIYGLIKY